MRKKPKIKYTEMAMYVDKNIISSYLNKDEAVISQVYEYLVMLAYMLSIKKRFFYKEEDYDNFSYYMANIVYTRMTSSKQWLPKDDPKYLTPIKSCLNYMKQIIYARKCAFAYEEFNSTTKNITDADTAKDYLKASVLDSQNDLLICDVEVYLKSIDTIIKNEVYTGVYANDKVLAWKLYTSVLLSLLNNFTLSNKHKEKLNTTRPELYEEVLAYCIDKENANAVLLYDLDPIYTDYISLVLQKVKKNVVNDIKELSANYECSDEMLEDLLSSNANYGEKD